jgi:DNA polymerase I-like protein with 3'-5' exonuclease and polymerase domains
LKDYAVLDFETTGILRRPQYPPKPVGFSLKMPGDRKSKYYAWGHPSGNNIEREKAERILKDLWRSKLHVLCHNLKFDCDVAETHFDLPKLNWERMEDTLFLLFFDNPHASSLSLKPSAQRILGIAPEERDVLKDWILSNIPEAKRKPSEWGAFICQAPGELVGKYADGDVMRTEALFKKLHEDVTVRRDMKRPYDRERHLLPIILKTERGGIRADLDNLERDYVIYQEALTTVDRWLRYKLHAPNLNLDADKDLGEVLDREGIVTDWEWTKGGKGRAPQRSVKKSNMTIDKFNDREIALGYAYRVRLNTCLSMFFAPWVQAARETGGMIYYTVNQVRQSHGNDKSKGTRTGRLSSDHPNFYNVSKNFEDKDDGYVHPAFQLKLAAERQVIRESLGASFSVGRKAEFVTIPGLNCYLPSLPLMRKYLLPDKGHVWLHRDWSQQELRVLAHFENGDMMKRYQANPKWDIHDTMQKYMLESVGIKLTRTGTKILDFSDIYGKGIGNLAESLNVDIATARRIRSAKNALMPGVEKLIRDIQARGRAGLHVTTWGGRQYYAEPPAFSKKYNRVMDFFYKLTNHIVQGSSADIDKEAIIQYDEHPKREARFLVTVYDEINSSAHPKRAKLDMAILKDVMEGIELDVPLLSEGKTGPSWGALEKYREA